MAKHVRKRNGDLEPFYRDKIKVAIRKAAAACGEEGLSFPEQLCSQVILRLDEKFTETIPDVEAIQDIVEEILIENRCTKLAKAYILYREKRTGARNVNALVYSFAVFLPDIVES